MPDTKIEEKFDAVNYDDLMQTVISEADAARDNPEQEIILQKSETWDEFTKTSSDTRIAFARFLYERLINDIYPAEKLAQLTEDYGFHEELFFSEVLKWNEPIPIDELIGWAYHIFKLHRDNETAGNDDNFVLCDVPFVRIFRIVNRQSKTHAPSEQSLSWLLDILYFAQDSDEDYFKRHQFDRGPEFEPVAERITTLLVASAGVAEEDLPYRGNLLGDWYLNRIDDFGPRLLHDLRSADRSTAPTCNRLVRHAASAKGSKPTKKFIAATRKLLEVTGADQFGELLRRWLHLALDAKATDPDESVYSDHNTDLIKGLVWMCTDLHDPATVNLIADLTVRAMKPQPGTGAASKAIANACLIYLSEAKGVVATTRLSQLTTAIKQKSVRQKIEKLVAAKAVEAGMTPLQLQERSVPDFGLTDGAKTIEFGSFGLRVEVSGPDDIGQTWLKPDGTPQKSKPSAVNSDDELKQKYKEEKQTLDAMKKSLVAQRDLIDLLFAEDVTWPLDDIEQYYVNHGLICALARSLIWELTTDQNSTPALFQDGIWQDVKGLKVETEAATTVRLWHPVEYSTAEREAWQERLAALEITQPTKQAHREVYSITEAERESRVYSNRMAAHIVKQHQAAALLAKRNWHYSLMGSFTYADQTQFASKTFSTSPLKAEFLFHTTESTDDYLNDAGMFNYVATDQLRFFGNEDAPVPLDTVPPRLFSETMRDADLVVGVASVGNDPTWFDQGPTPEARSYWDSFAFGELDSFAVTRKRVLEALLPRLKIRDVARIDGNFLIVEGKLNTYRIHLKSSNIQMDPGNRFLCIIKGPSSKAGKISLPFEGDSRLSVILSKAIMLAADDKITDPDIVNQLKH
ncbi:MAG: DUF4132 domain-containing protein [Roseibium sp.]|uniref:DUF4132 domain-containing protein n=1 Tax=Roseibium sp. TaxID=1936156 RepID=UPI002632016E|nr:DUF4132 domain-containing protein [Roseibium sp.]MCV0429475.1 DUF4132 domain-containing protein [Roseibium sp.]